MGTDDFESLTQRWLGQVPERALHDLRNGRVDGGTVSYCPQDVTFAQRAYDSAIRYDQNIAHAGLLDPSNSIGDCPVSLEGEFHRVVRVHLVWPCYSHVVADWD